MPQQLLDEVDKASRKFQGYQDCEYHAEVQIQCTRFAKLNSYKQYWDRINRLIEEGKYSRDRFKMEMHQKTEPAGMPLKDRMPERPGLTLMCKGFISSSSMRARPVACPSPA
jgi:hypothetical protein